MKSFKENYNRLLPTDFYYNENGLIVLTESYHLRRGFCCNNNCIHCPYNNVKGEIKNDKK